MRYILTLGWLLAATWCIAQTNKTQQVIYFKNDGTRVTSPDSSDFVRAITLPDSGSTLFGVSDFYRNGKPKLLGKSSAIDPPVFDGQCVTYYANGRRESVVNYTDGNLIGTGYLFYPNGKLHLTLEYDTTSAKTPDERMRILSCQDTSGTAIATNGNGRYIDYNLATGTISEQGAIKNGYPDGQWQGNYPTEKVTYTDTYANGKFVSGYCLTATGTKFTYNSRQQSPQFAGGDEAFIAYIKKKFKWPATLKGKSSMGILSFAVDKTGKVSNGRFLGNITPEINQAITTAINNSPNWKPAIRNGLPITSSWIVSATFGTVTPAKASK
jgi:antitoxin component YwqK of YwqJK toxin-antitoxin module